jgi:hypothetical protein
MDVTCAYDMSKLVAAESCRFARDDGRDVPRNNNWPERNFPSQVAPGVELLLLAKIRIAAEGVGRAAVTIGACRLRMLRAAFRSSNQMPTCRAWVGARLTSGSKPKI